MLVLSSRFNLPKFETIKQKVFRTGGEHILFHFNIVTLIQHDVLNQNYFTFLMHSILSKILASKQN